MSNYDERVEQLVSTLREDNLDFAIITSPANVFYYTGFNSDPHERFMALVINNNKQEVKLFIPALDEELAIKSSSVKNLVTISDNENPFEKLKEETGQEAKKIGIEKNNMNIFQYENLKQIYGDCLFVNMKDKINLQRLKKSPDEIKLVKNSIKLIEDVYTQLLKSLKIGMTELDITAELEYLMRKVGAEGPSFSSIVLSGENSALPHGTPTNRKLKRGDMLLIDSGVIKEGYCSDITRTYLIGEASNKQKDIYDIVLEANERSIDSVKLGEPLKSVDLAARNFIKEMGYGKYFNNRVGHGLGVEIHEDPSVHENNDSLIENGLLFTIEPGIYIPDFGGVRIEDIVYVNDNGKAEVLTTLPKELKIIPL